MISIGGVIGQGIIDILCIHEMLIRVLKVYSCLLVQILLKQVRIIIT